MLEIAEALATVGPRPRRSVVFCAWGAEERGLVGSKRFAEDPPIPFDRIAAYVNLDMISRNDPDSVDVVHSSDDLFEMVRTAGAAQGLEVKEGMALSMNASDTQAFGSGRSRRLPVHRHARGLPPPTDDPDRIRRPEGGARRARRVRRAGADRRPGRAPRLRRPADDGRPAPRRRPASRHPPRRVRRPPGDRRPLHRRRLRRARGRRPGRRPPSSAPARSRSRV